MADATSQKASASPAPQPGRTEAGTGSSPDVAAPQGTVRGVASVPAQRGGRQQQSGGRAAGSGRDGRLDALNAQLATAQRELDRVRLEDPKGPDTLAAEAKVKALKAAIEGRIKQLQQAAREAAKRQQQEEAAAAPEAGRQEPEPEAPKRRGRVGATKETMKRAVEERQRPNGTRVDSMAEIEARRKSGPSTESMRSAIKGAKEAAVRPKTAKKAVHDTRNAASLRLQSRGGKKANPKGDTSGEKQQPAAISPSSGKSK